MIDIATVAAIERSTYVLRATFTDEDGDPAVPTEVKWSLEDPAGNTINSRALVAFTGTLSSAIDIVLSGDDLALADQYKEFELRRLIVAAKYTSTLGTDLPLAGAVEFKVLNTNPLNTYRV
jgi:hypothetical protein